MTAVKLRPAQHEPQAVVGRDHELAVLLGSLEENGPLVTFVHGIAGIGKSTLLGAFVARARERVRRARPRARGRGGSTPQRGDA